MDTRTPHLLPSNATHEEKALSVASVFSPDILPEDIKKLWRPEEAPYAFLPLMAWGLHVDFWDENLPDAAKRALIKSSFDAHRYKGTLFAVKKILSDLGFIPTIKEWWQHGGVEHTFSVEANFPGGPQDVLFLGPETKEQIIRAIEQVKPLRSHLNYVTIIPVPPDEPEFKPDHLCRHDWCRYSHGQWPKPTVTASWAGPLDVRLFPASSRHGISICIYTHTPVFDFSRFGDVVLTARTGSAAMRRSASEAIRPDGYARPMWRTPYAYAAGVWDGGNGMDGINCVFSPGYWHYPDTGRLDDSEYSGFTDCARWVPVNSYSAPAHQRVIDLHAQMNTRHFGSCAVYAISKIICAEAPVFDVWKFGDVVPVRSVISGSRRGSMKRVENFPECGASQLSTRVYAAAFWGAGRPADDLNCVYSPGHMVYPPPQRFDESVYSGSTEVEHWQPDHIYKNVHRSGAVNHPGDYEISGGMRVSAASGLPASLPSAASVYGTRTAAHTKRHAGPRCWIGRWSDGGTWTQVNEGRVRVRSAHTVILKEEEQ